MGLRPDSLPSNMPETTETTSPRRRSSSLAELAWLSLKLGTIAFGGPAAHIALFHQEVVERRGWLTEVEFLDRLGAANLIPGPSSTELVIHIGHRRAGWPGLIVAGACFILPAALSTGLLAWVYVRFGRLPAAEGLLYAVKPVVIAIILQALWSFSRTALRKRWLALVGLAAAALTVAHVHPVLVLAAAGAVTGLQHAFSRRGGENKPARGLLWFLPPVAAGAAVAVPLTLGAIFATFVKIGSVLFGSGYVLLAFLRAEFVERRGWLTPQQLLDSVAVGQITPGPVFSTATFIGYILHGASGAAVATAGIFLPAFVLVAISAPLIPRLRRSALAGAVLDGINVGSLALMAVVTVQLAQAALVDWLSVAIAVFSALLLFRWRVNSVWLIAGAALLGIVVYPHLH
jgi:chromate transporter